jgi:hypothetical protein
MIETRRYLRQLRHLRYAAKLLVGPDQVRALGRRRIYFRTQEARAWENILETRRINFHKRSPNVAQTHRACFFVAVTSQPGRVHAHALRAHLGEEKILVDG